MKVNGAKIKKKKKKNDEMTMDTKYFQHSIIS